MFSISDATPVSIRRRPYISNNMQTVYKAPRTAPPNRLLLLQCSSFFENTAARIRNARTNRTASTLVGDMLCISVFEKRNEVPLATNTEIRSSFAFPLLIRLSAIC